MPPSSAELLALVQTYVSRHPEEGPGLRALAELLASSPDPTGRSTLPGHVTCSAVVVDDAGAVLHIRHCATGPLLVPGGHVEPGDRTPLAAALRALAETTGIAPGQLCLTPRYLGGPLDIDVHETGARPGRDEPAHRHFDLRFAFHLATPSPVLALQGSEVSGAAWVPFDRVGSPTLRTKLLHSGLDGSARTVNSSALIVNDEGQYLLHLRDDYPHIWAPGTFALLGGGREPGDASPLDTLRRELREEVPGLLVDDLEPFAVERAVGTDGLCVPVQVFAGRWNGDPADVVLNEGVLLHWFAPDQLHRLRLPASTRELIRRHAARAAQVRRARPAAAPAERRRAAPALVGVRLYLEDAHGRLLLGRRRPDSSCAAGAWDLPGGGCARESALECLVRSAEELIGVAIAPADAELVHTVHARDAPGVRPRLDLVFRCRLWTGEPGLRRPRSWRAWQWWRPDELPEAVVPATRAAIAAVRDGLAYAQSGW